ncbi:MAG: hypothetical protein IPL40_08855 [Proteobacteria bacterium]|nr:hypothetical protein [Pseudomonadota bacterium]
MAGTQGAERDGPAAPPLMPRGAAEASPAPLSEPGVVERLEGAATHPQVRRAQQLRRRQSAVALQRPFAAPEQAAQATRRAVVQATAEYRRYHALGAALTVRAAPAVGPAPSSTTLNRQGAPVGGGALGLAVGEPNPAGVAPSRRARQPPRAGRRLPSGEDACLRVARVEAALAASSAARRPEAGAGAGELAARGARVPGPREPPSVANRLAAELKDPPAVGHAAPSCVATARALRTQALELQAIFGSLSGWPAFEAEVIAPALAVPGPMRPPPGRIRYLGH